MKMKIENVSVMTNKEMFSALAYARPACVVALAAQIGVSEAQGTSRRVRVMLPLRESVSGGSFNLGEVLAVEAVAEVHGREGYMLRLGDDRATALAAAAVMAVAEDDPVLRDEIVAALTIECALLDRARASVRAATRATKVRFEGGEVESYAAADFTTDR
ncbi:MAG: phosphonate C-P lyase system protein PhnG [Burkholderiaceae bacterium]|jgi:alpha-D-ribose 1-methylphosphonate 5-triphosphate synthase subunit PhnG|nr:phosphonate C-P lyase system protein PhnG [Burkholderiaceae bacterium]